MQLRSTLETLSATVPFVQNHESFQSSSPKRKQDKIHLQKILADTEHTQMGKWCKSVTTETIPQFIWTLRCKYCKFAFHMWNYCSFVFFSTNPNFLWEFITFFSCTSTHRSSVLVVRVTVQCTLMYDAILKGTCRGSFTHQLLSSAALYSSIDAEFSKKCVLMTLLCLRHITQLCLWASCGHSLMAENSVISSFVFGK